MHVRSATKVGLAVVTSVAVFLAVWYFLLGQGLRSNTYPLQVMFPDAQNITPGADVLMAGVQIGTVRDVGLAKNNQALLNLRIKKGHLIPKGSRFVVTAGGLIGEKYVSIMPLEGATATIAEGATLQGQGTVQIEDLMAKASQLAGSADQVIREARFALADTRIAIRGMSRYMQDPRLKESLLVSMRNAEAASRNIAEATQTADLAAADLRTMMAQSKPAVQGMIASARRSTNNVEELTAALSEIVSGQDIKSGLGATMNNIKLASEQLPAITERMATIAANLEKLSGDPTMTNDLRATVSNLREASGQAKESSVAINEAVQRLTRRFRRNPDGAGGPTNASGNPIPLHGTVDLLEQTSPGHFHADVNAVVPFGEDSFVRAGISGLGEENRLNFQLGQSFTDRLASRYGLYRGRLGIGLDSNLAGENGWSVDLYRPNHPSMDFLVRRRLKENTSLVFGVEKVFQNPTPSVGIRIRK